MWKENPQVENTADGSQYSQESASLQSHPNARPCYDQRGQKSHLRLYRLQLARQMIKSRTVQLEQDWTSIVYFEELPEGNLFYAWKKQNKKNNMVTLAELHLNFANQSLVQEHWTAYKLSNMVMEMWLFGFVLQQKDLGTFSHWVHHKPLCIAKYSRAIYHYRNSRVRPSIW